MNLNISTVASLLCLIYLFHFKKNKSTELRSETEFLKEPWDKHIIWNTNMYRYCGLLLST